MTMDKFVKNILLKRKLLISIYILSAFIILFFTYLIGMRGIILYGTIPLLILIVYFNVKAIKFCSHCGRIIYRRKGLGYPPACSHCGFETQ